MKNTHSNKTASADKKAVSRAGKYNDLNFLVVNDDGISSPGMRALVDALGTRGTVYICAPDGERSAQSQAITITDPIRIYDFDYRGARQAIVTTGTPTDCTKVGLQLFHERGIEMDMVFSGINIGSNFGKDTLYSGTVGAAIEGALSNVRAVAVSVDSHSATHFDAACDVALSVIDRMMDEMTPDTLLNINAPDIPRDEVKGIKYTALGNRFYVDKFIPVEADEEDSFMMDGAPVDLADKDGKYDFTVTQAGYVSITPLQFDFTAYDKLPEVAKWDLDSEVGFPGVEWDPSMAEDLDHSAE